MGTGSLVNVVTSYCLRQMFRSRSAALRAVLREVWVGSARLGATCAVVAREVTRQNPDRALLSGLLANIGALPLIRALAERVDLTASPQIVESAVSRYGRQVGVMMLSKWGFEEWLLNAVRQHGVWHYTSEERDFAELVIVCDLLLRKSQQADFVKPSLESVPAISNFAAKWPDVEWTPQLLADLESSVKETEAELNS